MPQAKFFGTVVAAVVFSGAAQQQLHAGTIAGQHTTAEYYFNSNTNDSSGNGYNGAVSGTSTFSAGPGGRSAFSFDGGTQINTTTTDNLGLVNHAFTVDAWVNFSDVSSDHAVFGTRADNPSGNTDKGLHLQERVGGNIPAIMMGFYSDDLQPNSPAVSANTWYNVAWVYDGAGNQSIYLNGDPVASSGGHQNFQGTGLATAIGNDCCAGNMQGAVSNLFVFDSALSRTDIQTAMNTVPEPSSFALVGCALSGLAAVIRRRR